MVQAGDGVEGIANAAAVDFKAGNLEARLRADGQSNHFHPILGAGPHGIRPKGGLRTRDEDKAVEGELLQGILGRDQMALVNRVEAAPI